MINGGFLYGIGGFVGGLFYPAIVGYWKCIYWKNETKKLFK